jgi:enamine deaminase RidA (YjgF/YER057c/UK114 family)
MNLRTVHSQQITSSQTFQPFTYGYNPQGAARATVEASRLPRDVSIEIDAIAVVVG